MVNDPEFNVGGTATRCISGIALSGNFENSKGWSYEAQGLLPVRLPIALRLEHDAARRLGLVVDVRILGNQIQIHAELDDSDLADETWEKIVSKEMSGLSVFGGAIVTPVFDRTYRSWFLTEVSVTKFNADAGAIITKVWEEMAPDVSRPSAPVHFDRRVGGEAPC